MIGPTGSVRVMLATKPVDFRKGAEGLAALVRETMSGNPFDGAVYVFRAKRADRIKVIVWDGTASAFSSSGWKRGSSAGQRSKMASCACQRRSSRPSSRGSTGDALKLPERPRRQL